MQGPAHAPAGSAQSHTMPCTHATQDEKRELKECMEERPPECESFRYALFQCRKGQMDARTRIQGNKGY